MKSQVDEKGNKLGNGRDQKELRGKCEGKDEKVEAEKGVWKKLREKQRRLGKVSIQGKG